ncbi:glutamine--fructose-6-phosphate transaminase (isomerizing) [Candidatus Spongiihabitans sp.]|uniref:glutamine--fructose-6-phosphate transaminase (isomerizing) n=1 Tax=Candidatus Spongiihabitans sp. TaxID=3101308 RepID=UPI003C7DF5AB
MCGIVGAVAKSDVLPMLLDGLKRLEYRGYDSAGVAVIDQNKKLSRIRSAGKIVELEKALSSSAAMRGTTGIAHTRWATHGPPTEINAHPHISGHNLALVCNGIIENHEALRKAQQANGIQFASDTDTEVIVNEIQQHIQNGLDLLAAVKATLAVLEGAYAIGVVSADEPNRLVGARRGSPLVVGIGDGESFIASDMSALISVTRDFFILENGDIVDINGGNISIIDQCGRPQYRDKKRSGLSADAVELGDHRHYMIKEIHEQSVAIATALEGRITATRLLEACFGIDSNEIFDKTKSVQIIACGTSYHAGMVARHWFEEYGVPCQAEIGSEFHSRSHVVPEDCLVVTLSQSGETIDTLAALAAAKQAGYAHCLTICNVPESSLVRESDLVLMTHAGAEIGVASTKAFTTQLTALRLLVIALGRRFSMTITDEARLIKELRELPSKVDQAMTLEPTIKEIAEQFADKQHALFLGRGAHYPIALEGALKLKEISYIHAEAYPAGELKHGPLALVDNEMPVISVAPNDRLLKKLKGNIEEVRARGGKLIVFADPSAEISAQENLQVINVAPVDSSIAPIIYTIPLQLLAYHVGLIKGTDVDKPRNLAKSVTVE